MTKRSAGDWERIDRIDLTELVSKQQRLNGETPAGRSTSALILPAADYHIDAVADGLGVPPLAPMGYFQAAVQGDSGRWYDPLRLMCAMIEALSAMSVELQRLREKDNSQP